jgi:hypothetical protein
MSNSELKKQFDDDTYFHGIAESPSNSFSIYPINTPQIYREIYNIIKLIILILYLIY